MTKKPSLLKVVFDTSVLFTESASNLLCSSARQLIEDHSGHQDLIIEWILPSVVLGERQYQMTKAANKILLKARELERLLLISIGVDEKNLSELVDRTTRKQMCQLNVNVEELKTESINWKELVQASIFRKPPFGPSDPERGFRDCLVLETFLQVLKASASTPSACRVALVASDERLCLAATDKSKSKRNARVVESVEELEQLINTLVADVTEEFVQKIRENAAKYFSVNGDREGLYYREEVKDRIGSEFSDELEDVPEGANVSRVDSWTIHKPQFLKKQGQRVSWNTPITAHRKAFKSHQHSEWSDQPIDYNQAALVGAPPVEASMVSFDPRSVNGLAIPGIFQAAFSPAAYKKELVLEGETKFSVHWSASVSIKRCSFSGGSIDELLLDGTTWGY